MYTKWASSLLVRCLSQSVCCQFRQIVQTVQMWTDDEISPRPLQVKKPQITLSILFDCVLYCSTKERKCLLPKNTFNLLQTLQRLSGTDKEGVKLMLGRDSIIQEATFLPECYSMWHFPSACNYCESDHFHVPFCSLSGQGHSWVKRLAGWGNEEISVSKLTYFLW